jgi:aldose 1-epimerase
VGALVGYAVYVERSAPQESVILTGPAGAMCVVLPESGSQLARLRLSPEAGADAVDVLFSPGPQELPRLGLAAGAPVLFPWPGRITRGEYEYGGVRYRVPGPPDRHGLHGFVHGVPWRLLGYGVDAAGAWCHTRVEHAALQVPAGAFPGTYVLDVIHRLGPQGYAHEVRAGNVGPTPFPFGYGWHPYFRAPLTSQGSRAECAVRVPARARWELTPALVPTGRRLEVHGPYDLRGGSRLGDKSYDDPFTLLDREADGSSRAELLDPGAGLRVTVTAGPSFEHWVVYSPRTLGAVCLEPYTCVPDAFNLARRGVPTGLRELAPGAEWRDRITVSLAQTGE